MRKGFIKPCFHLDIKGEIPLAAQRTVRHGFFLWEFTVFCFIWNFVATLATLAGDAKGTDTSCGLATAWLILNIPSSYVCWCGLVTQSPPSHMAACLRRLSSRDSYRTWRS